MGLEQEIPWYKTFTPQKLQQALIVFLAMHAALSSFNPTGMGAAGQSQKSNLSYQFLAPPNFTVV